MTLLIFNTQRLSTLSNENCVFKSPAHLTCYVIHSRDIFSHIRAKSFAFCGTWKSDLISILRINKNKTKELQKHILETRILIASVNNVIITYRSLSTAVIQQFHDICSKKCVSPLYRSQSILQEHHHPIAKRL